MLITVADCSSPALVLTPMTPRFHRPLHEKAYSVICARPPFLTHDDDDDDSASCAHVISGGPVCSIFCARPPIGKCVVIDDDDDDDASCAAAMQLSLSPC